MYQYNAIDQRMVDERVAQFRDQTQRYLKGELSDAEFLPLRLQNGLYVQRLAPMLRIAVPYGTFNSTQMRQLAYIARHYDKGYGHFGTRQNLQINWPKLEEVPAILADLAKVQMHAIQTSGNCIRNITTDQFAGVAADELVDPRPYCELLRQWSTFHPEFAFLPRKFKIAVCAAEQDRTAAQFHDIAVRVLRNEAGELGFQILVGGGQGRTPVIAPVIHPFLPRQHLLTYLEAILRVYNQLGRRDNKYKARIKILVRALGVEGFRERVEHEWQFIKDGPSTLSDDVFDDYRRFFTTYSYDELNADEAEATVQGQAEDMPLFGHWLRHNVSAHKVPGYAIVTLSLKATGYAPGDISDQQMDAVAEWADRFSMAEIRSTHQQNLVLAQVKKTDLFALWQAASQVGLATANSGTLTDMICCPGGDFCSLANAKSIPIAEAIQRKFDDVDYLYDLGPIELNISGCMNACGHHHVGHIGVLGVDKKGREFYQIALGGSQAGDAAIAKILGPSFSADEVPTVIETVLATYVDLRKEDETFLATYRRVGLAPYKERVYAHTA